MTTTTEGRAGTSRGVKIGALALSVGLFAFIGVRVRETLADREAIRVTSQERAREADKRAKVVVVHGKPKTHRPTVPITGTLSPTQEAEVGFKAGGRLVNIAVKVGDQVKAGQLLAALDVAEARAQAAAAVAAARAAEVGWEMAKDAEKRTLALFEQHAVSDAENLAAKNRAALALAQLEAARAQAQLAATGVGNGTLGAPFSGLITRVPGGIGGIVGPGQPMFHLEDTSVLKLSATLSEGDARLLEVGDVVTIDGDPAVGGGATGKITAVLASLDPMTRRVPLVAEIPNGASAPLMSGAFVRATAVSGREIQVLTLPGTALRPGSQDELVVHQNGRAHLVRAVFTTAPDGALLVRAGVTAADAVVAAPSPEVREGDELGPAAE